MAKLVRRLAHNQKMRGFDSRSRNEGRQRATAEIDGKALHTHSGVVQRQDGGPLIRLSGFESLRRSAEHVGL
jgi:hypothetical protein